MFVTLNLILGTLIKDMATAMSIVGSTINPIFGFIIPIIFYWSMLLDYPCFNIRKIISILSIIILNTFMVMSLYNVIKDTL